MCSRALVFEEILELYVNGQESFGYTEYHSSSSNHSWYRGWACLPELLDDLAAAYPLDVAVYNHRGEVMDGVS